MGTSKRVGVCLAMFSDVLCDGSIDEQDSRDVCSDVDQFTARSQHREPRLDVIITCILFYCTRPMLFRTPLSFPSLPTDSNPVFHASLYIIE